MILNPYCSPPDAENTIYGVREKKEIAIRSNKLCRTLSPEMQVLLLVELDHPTQYLHELLDPVFRHIVTELGG